ncbi:alpha/beta hydrolase [Nocardioides sambongensis]|uniref:alpha/beta hydrolase n=1 Tax=Nocardioides sambongensis TaxID=2589074 RepID=UPI001125BCA2|nr:alpha/beta hydrolase [Nocardioides sambongensis]
MTGVGLPAPVGPFAELRSTPARAAALAHELRAVAVGVEDVQAWAAGSGAPSWTGRTRDAHDHARTRFGRRLDRAEAALERAVVATDRFADRLRRLAIARTTLERERTDLNEQIRQLRAELRAAAVADAHLQQRARGVEQRASALRGAIGEWAAEADDAEADVVAALSGVDTVTEGLAAAEDPRRVDVTASVRRLTDLAGDPVAVAAWWAALTRAQRQGLITERPDLVGRTGGVPVRARDEANRAAVRHDLDRLGRRDPDRLSETERQRLENARRVHEAIESLGGKVDPVTGEELLRVIGYGPADHDGDGGVVVGLGNPDTADHVAVTVPGLTTETDSLPGQLDHLEDLYDAAVDHDRGSVACVYWADYDAPSGPTTDPLDYLGVATDARAEQGGERLSDFLDGLAGSDRGDPSHLTAIGHSYGSTTLGHALQDGVDVDDAVLLGSPGVPSGTAAGLTGAEVWVGSMDNDPVTLLGEHDGGGVGALGRDPASDDFGAQRFATGDGSPRFEDLLDNHGAYFEDDALANISRVVVDDDAAVSLQPRRGDPGGAYLPSSCCWRGRRATGSPGGCWSAARTCSTRCGDSHRFPPTPGTTGCATGSTRTGSTRKDGAVMAGE